MKIKNKTIVLFSLGLLLAGAVLFLYYKINPSSPASIFPSCPSRSVFGIYCPGCGSQRAIHALLHGDFSLAWSFNPVLVILLPLSLILAIQFVLRHIFGYNWRIRLFEYNPFLYGLFLLLILYMILRNIPHPSLDALKPPTPEQLKRENSDQSFRTTSVALSCPAF